MMKEESMPHMEKLVKAPKMKVMVAGSDEESLMKGMDKAQEILRAKSEDEDYDSEMHSPEELLSLDELAESLMGELPPGEMGENLDEEMEEEMDDEMSKKKRCGCPRGEDCDCPMLEKEDEEES